MTVKVCGITLVEDALACIELGVDAIGLNFYAGSPRYCSRERAKEIVDAVGGRVLTVGVVVDEDAGSLRAIKESTGVQCLQLHGDESPKLLEAFLPHAYKALRVRDAHTVRQAARYGGKHILLDAYVPGQAGGTGARFDWSLAAELARHRKLALAGGLTVSNVAEAVETVQPFCVDVASGVEVSPGQKDLELVRQFVERAKAAVVERAGGLKTPGE